MVNSSGSYDNAYNRHLRDIIQDYDNNAMYSNPPTMILHGGMRQNRALNSGNSPYFGLDDTAQFSGSMYGGQVSGGVNRLHKAQRWSKFVRDLLPKEVRQSGTKKAVEMIEGGQVSGGKVNRLHKAQRWSKFVRDLLPKEVRQSGTKKAVEMIEGGKVNRLHKAQRWSKFARDLIPKEVRQSVTKKAVEMIGGKKPNPWIQHVKAYQMENGVSYKEAMKLSKASYKK
jgi:hypothetical protein